MWSQLDPRGLAPLLLVLLAVVMTSPPAASDDLALDETTMSEAIGYLSVLRGAELSADDEAWIKAQWSREHEAVPRTVAAQIDELAVRFERHRQTRDPVALANARASIVENAYCVAEQSSDPARHRLRDILAPDDLVVAADCLLGLVVTPFDLDGLVASHALVAEATGATHDPARDRAELGGSIADQFDGASPIGKGMIGNGELRHAILARFWSRIDGRPEQTAVVAELQDQAAGDLGASARRLESLALSKLAEVDYLAKAGDAELTASAFGLYVEWLQRIAGYAFSARDLAWLQQTIVDGFHHDPAAILNDVAGIKSLTTDYHATDGAEAKQALVASWAADLHCYQSISSDPDDRRLGEMIFREDPVTEADCQAGRISRKSQTVIVEADGQALRERDIDTSIRFMSLLLGRPLLPEERAVIREDEIGEFNDDAEAWRRNIDVYRDFVRSQTNREKSLFLALDEKKKLFDPIYCGLRESDDPKAADYLAMFQRNDAIVFEDCARKLVTTSDEVDALVSFVNFLALLDGKPPLSESEAKELRQSVASNDLDHAESMMSAVSEWWSLLDLEERAMEIEKARRQGIGPDADEATIAEFVKLAKLGVIAENARRDQCRMMAIVAEGETAIFAGRTPMSHQNRDGDPVGFATAEWSGLYVMTNMFAEFCR